MAQLKYWDGSAWINAVVGAQGITGTAGLQGTTGSIPGFPYTYITTTTATDPGAGNFGFNSTTAASITQLYISETDGEAGARSGAFVQWGASTTTSNKGTLSFTGTVGGGTATFTVTGASTDNGTWRTFPVSYVSGAFPGNTTKTISFSRTGDLGLQGTTGLQGATGLQGVQGTAGAQGTAGVQGASGGWNTTQSFRSVTGASDIPTLADNGYLITIDTISGAVTVTINASLGLSAGQRIDFSWIGAATSVTFSASSTTINGTPGLKLRARYSAATLLCLSANNYILVGDLIA